MMDGRQSVTTGAGPIVLRVENGYGFCEHNTVAEAEREASRLAERLGGSFVVLVPVAIVRPAPKTVSTTVEISDLAAYLRDHNGTRTQHDSDDEYPF